MSIRSNLYDALEVNEKLRARVAELEAERDAWETEARENRIPSLVTTKIASLEADLLEARRAPELIAAWLWENEHIPEWVMCAIERGEWLLRASQQE